MSGSRIFLALWPDEAIRQELVQVQQVLRCPKAAKVVSPERFHLTLHFLGQVSRERVDALRALRVPMVPFTLTLERVSLLPQGIPVLEPTEATQELLDLHQALAQALIGLGFHVEARPFRPHVTLARNVSSPLCVTRAPSISWHMKSWVVVQSFLGRQAHYRVLPRI